MKSRATWKIKEILFRTNLNLLRVPKSYVLFKFRAQNGDHDLLLVGARPIIKAMFRAFRWIRVKYFTYSLNKTTQLNFLLENNCSTHLRKLSWKYCFGKKSNKFKISEEEQRVEWNEVRDGNSKILLLNYARLVKCFTNHISSFKQAQ